MSGVSGQDRLLAVAGRLPPLVDKELQEQLRSAFNRPVDSFRTAVKAAIAADLPSGYAPVFAGAFRINASTYATAGGAGIKLVGTARGKAGKRDSRALDAGRLKHPVFGRTRRTRRTPGGKARPWVTQPIRPGFWTVPGRKLIDDQAAELEKTVAAAARRVEAKL